MTQEIDHLKEWSLRDEILLGTHRWPMIVVFFLAGCLIGWLVSLVWPASYQATTSLYVGLDPFRAVEDRYIAAFANVEFRNPDDYKHWQMQQLNVLAFSDAYLQGTLERLRRMDSFWDPIDVATLRRMLRTAWRNAGDWQLSARGVSADQASQAVDAWREEILEQTEGAIASAEQLYPLDLRLRAITAGESDNSERQARLERAKQALQTWEDQSANNPGDEPLEIDARWRLSMLAAQAAGFDPDWRALLEAMPPPVALAQDYRDWIDRLLVVIDQESATLEERSKELAEQRAQVTAEWEQARQLGQGLAATMTVEKTSDEAPQVDPARSTSLAALIGGLIGLITWGLYTVLKITRRVNK